MATAKPKRDALSFDPVSLAGRDEMNLAEFPIALVTDRQAEGQKTLYFEDEHGRLTITGSDAYGLPTAMDSDVIVALIYLTKLRNNFAETKVNFSRYELIKLLGWRDEKDSYKRLDLAFNRWGGVFLVYDKCWWNNKLKCYTSAKIHIIENVEIISNAVRRQVHDDGQNDLPLSTFTWDKKFIESCQADNLRQLNLDVYFSLKSAISKRLYRFLGKRFYLRRDWTFDLHEIAFNRVGLSRKYADAYKIKEKLLPAIGELEGIGFLEPLDAEKRFKRIDRGQWTIQLARSLPALAAEQPPATSEEPSLSPAITELIRRGVSGKAAADLAERHMPETIAAKVEVFDWLLAQKDKRVAKSPAGYLVKSINDDYALPKGFVSQAERDRQRQAQQAEDDRLAASRRADREAEAREQTIKTRVAAHRQTLSPEQLAQVEAEAIAAASDDIRESLDSPPMRLFRQTLISRIIDEHLARTLEDA